MTYQNLVASLTVSKHERRQSAGESMTLGSSADAIGRAPGTSLRAKNEFIVCAVSSGNPSRAHRIFVKVLLQELRRIELVRRDELCDMLLNLRAGGIVQLTLWISAHSRLASCDPPRTLCVLSICWILPLCTRFSCPSALCPNLQLTPDTKRRCIPIRTSAVSLIAEVLEATHKAASARRPCAPFCGP